MIDIKIYCLIQKIISIKTKNILFKNLLIHFSLRSLRIKQATARHITNDSLLFQKNVKYEKQGRNFRQISDNNNNNSTSSELSGHDSESIYDVFTPKKQCKLIIIIIPL
jgi:hypothetical protein